jgi:predicted small lipoprotein YifL
MKTPILGSLLLLALTLLNACGFKGSLELPDDTEFKNRAKFPEVLLPSKSPEPPVKP